MSKITKNKIMVSWINFKLLHVTLGRPREYRCVTSLLKANISLVVNYLRKPEQVHTFSCTVDYFCWVAPLAFGHIKLCNKYITAILRLMTHHIVSLVMLFFQKYMEVP